MTGPDPAGRDGPAGAPVPGGRDGPAGGFDRPAGAPGRVLAALAGACPEGEVRPAGPDDRIGGVPASAVAVPASTRELAAVLRACAGGGYTAVPRGTGTAQQGAAPPSSVDVIVDTTRLSGVRRHAAGDLVATVAAGTPLAAVQRELARAGQRLVIDPPDPGATMGGILASGVSGPLRLRYGPPRDCLIGAEFVRADGTVARAGGQVVKNVAGYDVGRLLCGSFGTLAVLSTVTFRLHPLPAARAFVCVPVGGERDLAATVDLVLGSRYAPAAVEVDLPAAGAGTLAVLLEGTPAGVDARAAGLAALLGGDASRSGEPPDWWGSHPAPPRTRDAPPGAPGVPPGPSGADGTGGGVLLRLSVPVAEVAAVVAAVRDAVPAATVRGSAGTGVLHVAPGPLDPARTGAVLDRLRAAPALRDGWCVLAAAPPEVWRAVDGWGPVPGLELMRRVKDRFDPGRLLSPGRFVGGL